MEKKPKALNWTIWGLTVLFLFYEFFIRVFPTAMVRELMSAFSVTATSLGMLSAFYFYAYAPMQIPVGLLMDRFGARKLLTFASLLCGIGSFFFAFTHHLPPAEFGRFLMGIGSAFGFVGMVYVCSHWFPAKKLGLLVGLGNSIGMLGAAGAEGPLALFVNRFGWRPTVHMFGIVGIGLALAFYLLIHGEKRPKKPKVKTELRKNLKLVCVNYRTWLNAIVALLFYMTTAAFASLWGIPFLTSTYGMPKELAGYAISMIFIGWIIGGPLIGILADRCRYRKPIILFSIVLTCLFLLPVIYIPHLSVPALFTLLFFVGFFSSAQLLNFSLAIDLNPLEAKGTSIALTNFVIAMGSSIMQPLCGYLLDLGWDGVYRDGVRVYTQADYHTALISFPVTLVLAFILLIFLKEKPQKKKGLVSKIIGVD